jgi:hypothetical protein
MSKIINCQCKATYLRKKAGLQSGALCFRQSWTFHGSEGQERYGSCVAPLLKCTPQTEWLEIPIPLCNKTGLPNVLDVRKATQRVYGVCRYICSVAVLKEAADLVQSIGSGITPDVTRGSREKGERSTESGEIVDAVNNGTLCLSRVQIGNSGQYLIRSSENEG